MVLALGPRREKFLVKFCFPIGNGFKSSSARNGTEIGIHFLVYNVHVSDNEQLQVVPGE